MGGYFSKIGSDPYYANYEKSFQRLKKDIDRLSIQTETRLKTRKVVAHSIVVWSTALFVVIALFAAWVLRQPEGTYTPQEHALRVSPILIEPLSAYSLHCIIQGLLKIRDKRLTRRLVSLETKMKRMIHDLKDSTRYDKTQKLLEKYDPEYVPSSPSRGFSDSTHFAPATTPGLRHRHVSNMQAQSNNPGMMSPLAGLQRGVGAAGSRVVPLLSSLAGMVGDNPALIEGLKTAQSEAEKLRSQVEKLQSENRMLRMRLGEDAPKQEPVTPRSGPSGIGAISDITADNSAEAHQQLAGSSDEPVTPLKGCIDSNDTKTGEQQTDPAVTSIDDADSHRGEKTVRKRK
ncbi:TPA: hypothetical protein ACH3X2_009707 [Trebouxia sp. C0005]|nr:MAG: hypothetical protein FRX49_07899 [Trebouxia sp. A1-2]